LLTALVTPEKGVRENCSRAGPYCSKELEGTHHIQPFYQCPPAHNVLWAKTLAEGPPFGPLNGPPLRMDHFTGERIHPIAGDLHLQILLGDLVPSHKHQVYRAPKLYRHTQHTSGWPSAIIITIVTLTQRAYAFLPDSLSHLNLISLLSIVISSYFTQK
jgi:hypothetical protein